MAALSVTDSICVSPISPCLEDLEPKVGGEYRKEALFEYLTEGEWEKVAEASTDERVQPVADMIARGEWDSLFRGGLCTKDRSFSYILIAAYTQKRISSDDLSTALLFHRAFCNTNPNYIQILPVTSESLKKLKVSDPNHKNQILDAANRSPENQRFIILISGQGFDPTTRELMSDFSLPDELEDDHEFPNVVGLVYLSGKDEAFGVCSVGICRDLYKTLTPVIHLTPTREEMERHIIENRSDAVLLFPDEEVLIHGSLDKTIFGFAHDLFHTTHRERNGDEQPKMLERAAQLQIDPQYLKKTKELANMLQLIFTDMPTVDEYKNMILDLFRNEIVDGFVPNMAELISDEYRSEKVKSLSFGVELDSPVPLGPIRKAACKMAEAELARVFSNG